MNKDNNMNIAIIYAKLILKYLFLIGLGVITLIPFLWMVLGALKTEGELIKVPIQWLPSKPSLNNFREVFSTINFFRYYINSLKLSVCITGGQLLFCPMAGFAFAKLRFPVKNFLFMLYLSTMMVPFQSIMIPQFLLIKKMGLYDTHLSVFLLQCFPAFGVFLLRQFFRGIPNEMIEAAKIDGASYYYIYWKIFFPLGKPAISSIGIIAFINTMNDFLMPFLYLNSDQLRTITLGLRSISTEYSAKNTVMLAGVLLSVFPMLIIFIFGQKQIINSISISSGVKG